MRMHSEIGVLLVIIIRKIKTGLIAMSQHILPLDMLSVLGVYFPGFNIKLR